MRRKGNTMPAKPSTKEMQEILEKAERCLECDAPECHEMTPEGVDACAELQYWQGRPVQRSTLIEWRGLVKAQHNGKK